MDRIFHQRFTLQAKCTIILFAVVAFWLIWQKMALWGFAVAVVTVIMTGWMLNTIYTFHRNEEGIETLVVSHGKYGHANCIRISDIVKVTPMKAVFGLSHYLLVQYGNNHLISLQPEDERALIAEIKKRQ